MKAPAAACGERDVDPRWFEVDATLADHVKARAVCRRCPRAAACLAEGVAGNRDGIYGGRLLERGREVRQIRVDVRSFDDKTLRGYHAAYAGGARSPVTDAAETEYQNRMERAARAAARASRTTGEKEASAA